jgi:hypothetical protein
MLHITEVPTSITETLEIDGWKVACQMEQSCDLDYGWEGWELKVFFSLFRQSKFCEKKQKLEATLQYGDCHIL